MRALIVSSAVAAALFGAPVASAQTGNFCLKSTSGATNCIYQTMAQCEQAKKGNEESCVTRTETTGAGAAGSPDKPSGSTMGSPAKKN
jgi:hypothetical protein